MEFQFSASSHFNQFKSLSTGRFDVIVIGGGITGAGIAVDAAKRGLKVVLFEKGDFASGTSSRSTKLIHGGLRYLKQLEIGLVREVGMERSIVHKMAPHMVIPEKMLLPLVEDGTFGKWATSLGLWVYDVLAGVDGDDRREMLNQEETLVKEPLLNPEKLIGSGYYAEYRTDDARLTIENMKKAAQLGAMPFNYCHVKEFIYKKSKAVGVKVFNEITGEEIEVKSNYIINAAGPWVDTLRDQDHSLEGKRLHLTKGVHIVVPHAKFPLKQAVYFDVPDGRMIFAIPRGKITYIGTTDTDYKDNKDLVLTKKEDADYLLSAVMNTFPSVHLTIKDVCSSWAGLRPLIHEDGKSASELSRKDEIFESESGLLSIAGGKLTGYRKMAERIVDVVMERMYEKNEHKFVKCSTDSLTLPGGDFKNYKEVEKYTSAIEKALKKLGVAPYESWYLVSTYGKQTDTILSMLPDYQQVDDIREKLLMAELDFSFENEMICRPVDYLVQRSGRLYFDIESVNEFSHLTLKYFAKKFGWGEDRIALEKQAIDEALKRVTTFA
jgi:glycerol-3-phosphate dehydrogenase